MNIRSLTFERPRTVFLWMLGFLSVLFLVMESWRYSAKPTLTNKSVALHQSLNDATKIFYGYQHEFLEQSKNLSYTLYDQIQQRRSLQQLHATIEDISSLWGVTLLKNDEPLVWHGFSISPLPSEDPSSADSATVSIVKQNNVLFWHTAISFTAKDSVGEATYQLHTARLIEQENALSIKGNSAFNLVNDISRDLSYPVQLSVFNPLPDEGSVYTVIKNSQQDSIGVFYASPSEYKSALKAWEHSTGFWRSVFVIFCFACLSLLFYLWIDRLPNLRGLFYQLTIIGIGWLVIHTSDIPMRWIPDFMSANTSQELIAANQELCKYIINSIFFFLAALTLNRKTSREAVFIRSKWYPIRIFVAALFGFINVAFITWVIYQAYAFAVQAQTNLLGLQLLPPLGTLIFYLGLGLTLYSLGLALISLNRLILRSGHDQHKLIGVVVTISFLLGLIIAQLIIPDALRINWAFSLSILTFGVILGIAYLFKVNRRLITGLSILRIIAIVSLLVASASITILYNAYVERQDRRLHEIAQSFTKKSDPNARELTAALLTRLSDQLGTIDSADLDNRVPYIQNQFTQTIEQIISGKNYSVDVHLVRSNGESIAEYSTDLSSPGWVSIFDLRRLSLTVRMERINKITNRPIIQQPNIQTNRRYRTFYRGWIQVFESDSDQPIAWILTSVYAERLDFDRPINAVMASLPYDDLNKSYQVLHYVDSELQSSSYLGITTHFPTFTNLLETEIEALQRDSLVYYTNLNENRSYRCLLMPEGTDRVIKISTTAADFRNVLFAFFRFNFIMLFASALGVFIANITKLREFTFLGKNERFQDRIADNFLMATLVFLTLLVIATHIAIRDQNENIVKQELFTKLQSLATSIERNRGFQESQSLQSHFILESLATPLNVDASFYNKRNVTTSTTPQIYRQHLVPKTFPFLIYQDLYEKHKREALHNISFGGHEFLIGYRSIMTANNQPIAAVSIPTFVQSPKYDKQLLETTSYLIILYFFVFGFFIIGTTVISQQLTKPLYFIQQGLNKISQGDLDTTIPVTSKDEIGSLATAYNEMVHRLKELRKELAKAERESAWKEMAQQVAHEIKNPLTPMKLSIQHLERQIESDQYDLEELKPRIKKITDNLIEQIQSLNSIASDFSKFSKPIKEEFRDVSINEILCSVSDLYQHDEQITITSELAPGPSLVHGIADELQRVVINLVKNAYEAMPEGGQITLRSYCRGDSVFVEVEDNGKGIPEQDKSKIFVPNFSTKSSGTGLGLAICKKIVDAHSGSISFASIEDEGTTFVVKLPLKS